MTGIRYVATELAPKAIGPYSQATVFNGLVYTAGQIPLNPKTMNVVEGGVQEQTKQSLENLKAVLESAGSSLDRVLKTTVFIKDMNDFAKMNEIYGSYFTNAVPARSAVEVARLPKDVLVEIEAVAAVSK